MSGDRRPGSGNAGLDDLTQDRVRPKPKAGRGGARPVLVLVALFLLVGGGLYALVHGRAARRHQRAIPPEPVAAATVSRGDISIVLDGLGAVTPLATVNVQTQIAGQIMKIGFTEGQMVHKGDFLIQIDPRPYQVALETAQGNLARDQALLGEARTDLARYQHLASLQSIARQQAEDQGFLVKQYEGDIIADKAAIDSAKLDLTYCHITSPIDGRVGLRQVDLGNYVQPSGATPLVVITQIRPISVEFTLPEDDLPSIQRQMRVGHLAVAAYDRSNTIRLATGYLSALDSQVNNTTGTVAMRALFANQDDALFPQQFVNARLTVQTLHDVLTVPAAAVQHGAPGTFVFKIGAGNTVSVTRITTGPTDGTRVQVLSGLAAGDRVVTDGTDRLRDGSAVTIPAATPSGE